MIAAALLSLLTGPAHAQSELDAVYAYSDVSADVTIGVEAQRVVFSLDAASGTWSNPEGWTGEYLIAGNSFELWFVDQATAQAGDAATWVGTANGGLVCPSTGLGEILDVPGTPEWKHTACPIGRPSASLQVSPNNANKRRLSVDPPTGLLAHTPYAIVATTGPGVTVLPECPELEIPAAGGGVLMRGKTVGAGGQSPALQRRVPAALIGANVDLYAVDLSACQVSSPTSTTL